MTKKLLLLLVAMLLVGASAKATTFISDLMVSTHSNQATAKSQLTNAGYTVIDQDMNQGGGGQYVYIGYKTSTNLAEAITGLLIVSGSSYAGDQGQTVTQNGATFQPVRYTSDSKGGNLNRGRGASATDLYLYYTKYGNTTHESLSTWKPITGLAGVSSTTYRSAGTYTTYVRRYNTLNYDYSALANANLNDGGSASYYTFLNVTSTHVCSLTYELVSAGHRQYCSVCGYTRSTAACNFAWSNYIASDATQCYRVCTVCNLRTYYNHNWSGQYNYLNATQCFTPCANCGYQKKENHVWTSWQTYSTDQHRHVCGRCIYSAFENHNWSYTYNPSYHTMRCSVSTCGYSKTEVHTRVTDGAAVAATCTTAGSTEAWHCSLCTYSVAATTLRALGHQLVHVEALAPTPTAAGNLEYWYCTRCGHYYLDAACTEPTTLEGVTLPPLGQVGDVNQDGQVTIADVTALVNIILGKGTENAASDVNGDGQVTIADVTALVNLILGKS